MIYYLYFNINWYIKKFEIIDFVIKFFMCFVEVWIDRSFMFDVNIGKICKKNLYIIVNFIVFVYIF